MWGGVEQHASAWFARAPNYVTACPQPHMSTPLPIADEGGGVKAALTIAWGIRDQPGEAAAVLMAPVVGLQELPTVAAGAVRSELVGAKGALLTRCRSHIISAALAAKADGSKADEATVMAIERREAPTCKKDAACC